MEVSQCSSVKFYEYFSMTYCEKNHRFYHTDLIQPNSTQQNSAQYDPWINTIHVQLWIIDCIL